MYWFRLSLIILFKACINVAVWQIPNVLLERVCLHILFTMKAILLLAAALAVFGTCGVAVAGSATQEAMDEEVATNRALSKVPQGKKVTGTSCTSIEIGMGGETSYRCTATWDWRRGSSCLKRHFSVVPGFRLNLWCFSRPRIIFCSGCFWRLCV